MTPEEEEDKILRTQRQRAEFACRILSLLSMLEHAAKAAGVDLTRYQTTIKMTGSPMDGMELEETAAESIHRVRIFLERITPDFGKRVDVHVSGRAKK